MFWYSQFPVWYTTLCGGMYGLPSLVGLGQHLPPAVSQQSPHVPGLLQSEVLLTPTECIVKCVCGWGDGRSERQGERREGREK